MKDRTKEIFLKWDQWVELSKRVGFDPRESEIYTVYLRNGVKINYICIDDPIKEKEANANTKPKK